MQTNRVATIAKRPMTIPQYTSDISHALARVVRVLIPVRRHIAMRYASSALPHCTSIGWLLEMTSRPSFNVGQPDRCRPTLSRFCSRHIERISAATVDRMPYILNEADRVRTEGVRSRPCGRKHTRRRQLCSIAGKNSFGEKATPARHAPLDLHSTEDHGNHLRNEAGREPVCILCPDHAPVKGEHNKTLVEKQGRMIRMDFLDDVVRQ